MDDQESNYQFEEEGGFFPSVTRPPIDGEDRPPSPPRKPNYVPEALKKLKRFRDPGDKKIMDCYLRLSLEEKNLTWCVRKVCDEMEVTQRRVERCLAKSGLKAEATQLREAITEEVYKGKVPFLKEVVGLSLNVVKDFLVDLTTNQDKKDAMTAQDAKHITNIAKDLNELLRLELGEATQNIHVVQHTLAETKIVLEDLRKKDKIFDYPEIEDGE